MHDTWPDFSRLSIFKVGKAWFCYPCKTFTHCSERMGSTRDICRAWQGWCKHAVGGEGTILSKLEFGAAESNCTGSCPQWLVFWIGRCTRVKPAKLNAWVLWSAIWTPPHNVQERARACHLLISRSPRKVKCRELDLCPGAGNSTQAIVRAKFLDLVAKVSVANEISDAVFSIHEHPTLCASDSKI